VSPDTRERGGKEAAEHRERRPLDGPRQLHLPKGGRRVMTEQGAVHDEYERLQEAGQDGEGRKPEDLA
jgi:hypothetical protein